VSDQPVAGLSDTLKNLRTELAEAMKEGAGESITFDIQEIQIELHLGVTVTMDGKAAVKFWVISADSSGSLSRETVHTLKLTLKPLRRLPGGLEEDLHLADTLPVKPA
jgi:hypothetical protein